MYYPERLSLTVQDNRGPRSALSLFVECLFQTGLCQALGGDGWKARSALGKQRLSQCMEGKAGSAGSRGGWAPVPSTGPELTCPLVLGSQRVAVLTFSTLTFLGGDWQRNGGTRGPLRADLGTRMGCRWGIWRRSQEHGQSGEMERGKKESCWQASGQTFQGAPRVHSPGDQLRM